MIAKVGRGADMAGLVRYLFGAGREEEHTGQRVVAADPVLAVEVGVPLDSEDVAVLARRLEYPHAEFGVDVKEGYVWHLSLSNRADDRELSDAEWGEAAQLVMDRMGFTEATGKAPCRWVAVRHGRSTAGNDHIHIAVSLVREDGTAASAWMSQRTVSAVCAELEQRYGLLVVEGRAGRGMPGLTRGELEKTAREQRAEPPRLTLGRLVREASVASKDEAEFIRRLRGSGVLVRPRFETGGQDAVVGYSVALRPADGPPIWFGGGKLARDLTLPNLRQFWELSPEDRRAAVVEWKAARSTPGREAVRGGADDWQRAVAGIEQTVEHLRAVPVADLAAWRGAAREAAGVFAAWSRRFEGDHPGPLAAAADALARSAQTPGGGPGPTRDAVRDLRGVAAIVAQSELNNRSPLVWAMLVDQLGRTLRAISDAHVARGETETAKLLAGRVSAELSELHDQFQSSTPRELGPEQHTEEDRVGQTAADTQRRQPRHRRERGPGQDHGVER